MQRIFYSSDSDNNAGTGYTNDDNRNKKNFPEDPGTTDHRVPDGGGPADGFIDKDGHSNGEGFLGHVEDEGGTKPNTAGTGGKE